MKGRNRNEYKIMLWKSGAIAHVITAAVLSIVTIGVNAEITITADNELTVLGNGKLVARATQLNKIDNEISQRDGKAVSSVKSATIALQLGADKASALGYDLNKHLIKLTQKEDHGWEVYFHPQHEKKGTRGGGITVHVDQAGTISKVQRWR